MDRDLGFKRTSYGLFTFVDFLLIYDFRSIERNQTAIARTRLQIIFFHPELEFFVLDLKVHHSNSIILIFLSWFANTTNSKANNLPI